MLFTTTPTVEGHVVKRYCGVLATEVIFGANVFKDMFAGWTDVLGGRSSEYEKVFADAREQALSQLRKKAEGFRADAVINIKFAYQVLGEKNGMMMVAATGTAVVLEKSEALKAEESKDSSDHEARFMVSMTGRELGPFSKVQMRDLLADFKISEGTGVRFEDGKWAGTVAEVTK